MAEASASVRACPREGVGAYVVEGQTWKVGERYELVDVIGSGSFSTVCLARDKSDGTFVAIKLLRNVFSHMANAKSVIREVFVQRQLRHPNIVELKDVFSMPSPTGRWRMVGGKLVTDSVDVYMVMEHENGGDLYELSGQLTGSEVRSVMHQLLQALDFLHSCGVIHRDIKSSNVLTHVGSNGERVVKLADFGQARPASYRGIKRHGSAEDLVIRGGREAGGDMEMAEGSDADLSPSSSQSTGFDHSYFKPMTAQVSTPCYRAPEVIMSLDDYNSTIDLWSLGCIFAELLSRLLSQRKGWNPQLKVFPLFNLSQQPLAPDSDESWEDGEGGSLAHRELRTVFEVTGTPSWAQANAISDERWRKFLRRLPGHAPTLMRRFPGISEVEIDLLKRMLEFGGDLRCTAMEVLCHEYFAPSVGLDKHLRAKRSAAEATPSREGGEIAAEAAAAGSGELFTRFEQELESLLAEEQSEEGKVKRLKQILDREIDAQHKQSQSEAWLPASMDVEDTSSTELFKPFAAVPDALKPKCRDSLLNPSLRASGRPALPEDHLVPGRHRDWTTQRSCEDEPPSPRGPKDAQNQRWGVSVKIPGMTKAEADEIARKQQCR